MKYQSMFCYYVMRRPRVARATQWGSGGAAKAVYIFVGYLLATWDLLHGGRSYNALLAASALFSPPAQWTRQKNIPEVQRDHIEYLILFLLLFNIHARATCLGF